MIEEMNQPDKRVDQRDPEFQEDFDRALKQVEAVLRLYYPEEVDALKVGETLKVRNLDGKILTTGEEVRRGAKAKRVRAKGVKAFRARAELVLRGVEAISREVGHLPPDSVDRLLRSSDPRLLVGLARASLEDTPIDRMERMTLRGAERFQKLIENAGGLVSSRWVSEFLGVSEEAVRKRAQRGSLIARRTASGDLSFPRFQFDEGNARLLPGLSKLLTETESWEPEELTRFLLVRHEPASSDDTPLTLIQRGEVDRVLELAQVYMQQRA